MTRYLFPPEPVASIPMGDDAYPVRRIFCVGRNYAAHAAEMGAEVDREAPFYFTKTPYHLRPSGAALPYPPGTTSYHHEMELAFTLGRELFRADLDRAAVAIHGYACALDMTRRDLQDAAKAARRPWSLSKDVEGAVIIGALTPAGDIGALGGRRIALGVNGEIRQDARLGDMIQGCAEIVAHLSGYYHLGPGDVILTGTPAGIGPVAPGDRLEGTIDGLAPVTLTIGPPEG